MPHITIRNLTQKPLEVQKIERFEGEEVRVASKLESLAGSVSSLLNATTFTKRHIVPKGDSHTKCDVSIHVEPWASRSLDLDAPDLKKKEVATCVFSIEGHKYEISIPSPSQRSLEAKALDNGPLKLTSIYVPSKSLVTLFSSANLQAWMAELPDHYPLSLLSIPGTHNSPASHVSLPSVRCQAVGIQEQLQNGVRYFDIRVSVDPDSDKMTLVHSAFPLSLKGNKYFEDLVNTVYEFLDAHPREVLIMSIKKEGLGKGDEGHLCRYLRDRYVNKKRERWFVEPTIPTLGKARGRIVLLRRFGLAEESLREEHGGRGWGLDGAGWPDNCEDQTSSNNLLRVQDFYEIDESTNIEKKIRFCNSFLEKAAERSAASLTVNADQHPPFFINFLSASNFFSATCWPERIAAKVNPNIIEYLCSTHGEDGKGPGNRKVGDASTGIVVTDWVGANGDWDLIRCVVGMNARLP